MWHPSVVLSGKVDLDTLAKECAEMSSLSPGDVKNSIDNLIVVVNRHLLSGESVCLDGLGSFTPALNSTGKGVENEADVTFANSRLKINFRESVTRNTDRTVATRSLSQGASFVRVAGVVNTPTVTPPPSDGGSGNDGGGSGSDGGDDDNLMG